MKVVNFGPQKLLIISQEENKNIQPINTGNGWRI